MKKITLVVLALLLALAPFAVQANPVGDQMANFKSRVELVKADLTNLQSSGQATVNAFLYGKLLFHLNYASNLLSQAVALSGTSSWSNPSGQSQAQLATALQILDGEYSAGKIKLAGPQGEVRVLRMLLGLIKLQGEMARVPVR